MVEYIKRLRSKMTRDEQKSQYKWDISSVFETFQAVDVEIIEIQRLADQFISNKDNIFLNSDTLFSALNSYFELINKVQKVESYAQHRLVEDLTNSEIQGQEAKITEKMIKVMASLSFFDAELVDHEQLLTESLKLEKFSTYKQIINEILLQKAHTLDKKSEKLIAQTAQLANAPYDIYSTLIDADFQYEDVKDSVGTTHPLTQATYYSYLISTDRELRANAFASTYEQFAKYNNTLAKLYIANINSDKFTSEVRSYANTRQMALSNTYIPEQIYDNLIDVVNDNININYQYLNIRKKLLNVDQLHLYDVYVPLISNIDKTYTYEEAQAIVLAALKPLGEDYLTIVKECFAEQWIDVYPNDGKRSGAFSGGTYETKPFILLNYNNTLNDVYTLIHEIGHSIHTYLSNKNQEYHNSNYRIFIAEVASTLNELLLTNYLLEIATTESEKAYILNYKLEQYRTTVLRQTMFAEFEYKSKREVDAGNMLSAVELNDLYYQINQKYFGDDVVVDQQIKYEWSRIPHFYYNYYVYQYATSFCASVAIEQKIAQNPEFTNKYLEFLSLGASVDSLTALKVVDVDFSKKDTFENAMQDFQDTLDQFSKLV